MMPPTSVIGLVMCGLVAIGVLLQLLNAARFPVPARWTVFVVLAIAMAVPVDGVVIAGYVRGVIGDPSIATIAMMSLVCIKQLTRRDICDDRDASAFLRVVVVAGIVLYPMTLGLSPIDPYAMGFGSWTLYAVLFAIALAAWRMRFNLVVWWIVASVLAFSLGLFESTNLWNYLLDPIAVIIAIAWTAAEAFKWLRQTLGGRKEVIA